MTTVYSTAAQLTSNLSANLSVMPQPELKMQHSARVSQRKLMVTRWKMQKNSRVMSVTSIHATERLSVIFCHKRMNKKNAKTWISPINGTA